MLRSHVSANMSARNCLFVLVLIIFICNRLGESTTFLLVLFGTKEEIQSISIILEQQISHSTVEHDHFSVNVHVGISFDRLNWGLYFLFWFDFFNVILVFNFDFYIVNINFLFLLGLFIIIVLILSFLWFRYFCHLVFARSINFSCFDTIFNALRRFTITILGKHQGFFKVKCAA